MKKSRWCFSPCCHRIGWKLTLWERIRMNRTLKRRGRIEVFTVTGFF